MIIGALSGWQYWDRRTRCRETWVPRVTALGHDFVFLIGNGGAMYHGRDLDMLFLPCPNEYHALPQRTYHWCHWLLQQPNWEYGFKCDDDTYVAAERLDAVLQNLTADYAGVEWHPQMNYGSGGAGYFLSRRAVEIVARELTHQTGAEDLLVGEVLRRNGITLHMDEHLKQSAFGDEHRRPRDDNTYVTGHGISVEQFLDSHRRLYERQPQFAVSSEVVAQFHDAKQMPPTGITSGDPQ